MSPAIRIQVTGGHGFIGSEIITALLACGVPWRSRRGHGSARDRCDRPGTALFSQHSRADSRATPVVADATDAPVLAHAFAQPVDIVLGASLPTRRRKYSARCIEVAAGSFGVLETGK